VKCYNGVEDALVQQIEAASERVRHRNVNDAATTKQRDALESWFFSHPKCKYSRTNVQQCDGTQEIIDSLCVSHVMDCT